MREKPRTRKRAVRLTDTALEALDQAVLAKWGASGRAGRLTREVRAELLGVSVPTSERILAGGGVDRTTLQLAYKNIGLAWSGQLCTPIDESDSLASTSASPQPSAPTTTPTPQDIAPRSSAASLLRRFTPIYVGTILVAAVAIAFAPKLDAKDSVPGDPWVSRFNAAFDKATELYHRADYTGARVQAERAMEIALSKDSAVRFGAACRLAGDLYLAQGSLEAAETSYQRALDIKGRLPGANNAPSLHEALGDVQTKLGKFAVAEQNLLASLNGYRRDKEVVGVAIAHRNLGTLYFRQNRIALAQDQFQASLSTLEGLDKPAIVMDVKGRQALILQRLEQFDEARTAMKECLAYWVAQKHPRWIAECQFNLGVCEAAAGNNTIASTLLSASKVGFESVGDAAGARRASAALGKLATTVGGFRIHAPKSPPGFPGGQKFTGRLLSL